MSRFERTALLLGEDAIQALSRKRVAVFGLGGVGSWCCEALGRAGIGAQALIDCFERVRFHRENGPDDAAAMREILTCDLLILDDLGAEFATAYSQSVLYQVINDRMTERRPTIISTNLDLTAMTKIYNERILSRLIGSYTMLGFVGRDIRQQKLSRARGEAGV